MDKTRIEYCQKFHKFVEDYKFLLDFKPIPTTAIESYFTFFGERIGKAILCYYPQSIYSPECLTQFNDKVVYTGFTIPNQSGGGTMYSLIQLAPNYHVKAFYHYIKEGFWVSFEVYTSDGKNFLDFLTKNRKFEYTEAAEVGFGGLMKR